MSVYLTPELANQAIAINETAVVNLLTHLTNRYAGHLRISALQDGRWHYVASRDFSVREGWEHPYEEVAKSKDLISRRTGKTSREVQQMHPELTEPGDTIYYGNAVSPTKRTAPPNTPTWNIGATKRTFFGSSLVPCPPRRPGTGRATPRTRTRTRPRPGKRRTRGRRRRTGRQHSDGRDLGEPSVTGRS